MSDGSCLPPRLRQSAGQPEAQPSGPQPVDGGGGDAVHPRGGPGAGPARRPLQEARTYTGPGQSQPSTNPTDGSNSETAAVIRWDQ